MKKIIYLGIIAILTSCGPNKEQIKEEERMRMEAIKEIEEEQRQAAQEEAVKALEKLGTELNKITAKDKKEGEDISNDKEMNRAIDNAPMPNFEEEENSQDDEEDFDPESML